MISLSGIEKAFVFAYNAHKGKFRKGTQIPYFVHPLDVASILMKNEAPEAVVIAGLLHDVVEDEGVKINEIKDFLRKFGQGAFN